MKVMVVGAGRVGIQIGNYLSSESNDVIVIDHSTEAVANASDILDALIIHGDGASPSTLIDAGLCNCEMMIAVTSNDQTNIMACMTAAKVGVDVKIARLRNSEFSKSNAVLTPQDLGIDLIIHPELETARELFWLVRRTAATDVIEFEEGRVHLIGVRLDATSPILNRTLKEIDEEHPDINFRVAAIFRSNRTIIPTGQDLVNRGDQLFFITRTELVPRLLKIVGKGDEKMENIMILGGGKVGRLLASELEQDKQLNVKLIESSREKSDQIVSELQRTLLIIGDGTDLDLLASEGIMDMDSYIAVTDDEETNIISCLVAKHLGVRRSLALVNRSDYLPIMSSIGLDAAVDKEMITANAILRFIRRGNVVSLATLKGIDAEILQVEIAERSKLAGRLLRTLKMPKGSMIGVITRNGQVIVPIGSTELYGGDRLILFTLPSAVPAVKKLFNT